MFIAWQLEYVENQPTVSIHYYHGKYSHRPNTCLKHLNTYMYMFPLSCSRSRSLATSEWIVISKHDIGLVGDGDGDGAGPTFTLDWRFFLLLSLCLYFSIYNTLCPHFIFVFIHAGNHLFTFYMFSLFSPPQIYTHTHIQPIVLPVCQFSHPHLHCVCVVNRWIL